MLKITRAETPGEERWILQGRLVGLWARELRRIWKKTQRADDKRRCVVDLNEITFIDKKGEALLRTMSKQGAQLVATGIYIKHLLQQRCAR
jgi:anti-anti-sigma regulatory factor